MKSGRKSSGQKIHFLTQPKQKIQEKVAVLREVVLPLSVKMNFIDFIKKHQFSSPYVGEEKVIKTMGAILRKYIPLSMIQSFQKMASGTPNVMVVRNVPIDDELPPTPELDSRPRDKGFVSEYAMLGIADLLNCNLHLSEGEKDGNLIHQVIPISGKEKELSGAGSTAAFELHTENAHEKFPPDLFMLTCLRGDKNAATMYLPLADILEGLPSWVVEVMKTPVFKMKTGPSFTVKSEAVYPILVDTLKSGTTIRFNSNLNRIEPLTFQAKEALDYLRDHLKNSAKVRGIVLESGDCLIINNWKAMHGRTSFEISTSHEERRWLQHMYLRQNPDKQDEKSCYFKEKILERKGADNFVTRHELHRCANEITK
jgi:L-asparagine oxygenase